MTTPPAFPNAGRTAAAPVPIVVRLGNEDGDAPDAESVVEHLRLLRIVRSAGGRESDYAVFAYDLDKTGQRLVDLQTLTGWNRQIEVLGLGDTGSPDGEVLFWGDLSAATIAIDPTGEFATVQAVISPHLFGDPILGQKVIDPLDDDLNIVDYHVTPVFNPLVDGEVRKNMSETTDPDGNYKPWVDPDSISSDAASSLHGTSGAFWTIDEAINTLQQAWNGDEEFIENFDAVDNDIFDDAEELKNVLIRRGRYLPDALDALLYPLGFNWFVDFSYEDTADPGDGSDHEPTWEVKRSIVVFKRGSGVEKQVYFQRPGEAFDPTKSNAPNVGVNWDVADLANIIEGYGSFQEREITIELYRGWHPAHDHLKADDLDLENKNSAFYMQTWGRNVHRLWIANEAGDYTGLREEIDDIPDLRDVFDGYVPKRRRLYECLTFTDDENRQRRPAFAEWYNPEVEAWEPIPPEWGYTILSEQIGIYFTGNLANGPAKLIELGDDARIRVTGTIVGDQRINRFSTTSGNSPNSRDVTLFLDLSDRFHDRQRNGAGNYASIFYGITIEADEADDGSALQDYVDQLSVIEESAALDAEVSLHGIHFDYKIGDIVTAVEGRNISLNRNSPDSDTKRYMQITGLTIDYQNQQTILRVEADEEFV